MVRDSQSRYAEAEILYRDALEIGSDDPLTYMRYGRHLLARMRPESAVDLVVAGKLVPAGELALAGKLVWDEDLLVASELAAGARAAFARAVALDGEFAEARVLFGFAHLVGEVDPGPGIAALAKVRGWLPDRDDVTFFLLQLHLKDRNFNAAQRLLETVLRGNADDLVVRLAEEEIERAQLLHRAAEALGEERIEEALRLFDEAIAVTGDQDLRRRMAARLTVLQELYGKR